MGKTTKAAKMPSSITAAIIARNTNPVLQSGDLDFLIVNDEKNVLAYSRYSNRDEVIAVFNNGENKQDIILPVKTEKVYKDILGDLNVSLIDKNKIEFFLPAKSAAIIAAN